MNYISSYSSLFFTCILVGFGVAFGAFSCKLLTTALGAIVVAMFKKKKKEQ